MSTDRTVAVTLTANVSNYIRGMNDGSEATRRSHAAMRELAGTAGPALIGLGAAAAAFVGVAVGKFAEFDSAMSEVQASTNESAANMGLLRDAAVRAGADTVFSAKEAADAENELAKAGVSTADVLSGALAGSMSLASAGGLGVADAAELAATAMTQFKLAGSDVPHIADLLAAGAGKAQGSVDDLGQALKQGGLVASQAGQSIEETTGVLAAFASAGLIGSDAGTSLKTMLLALENPSAKASDVMSEYGINVYDAQGKMLGFSGIADQLKTRLGGLTDEQRNSALATIFGSDAVRSASVLYAQGGDGIADWTDKVNDSGYAADQARQKLDNLNGDLEYLKGSIDTALIQTGSAANGSLRDLVQTITLVVDGVGKLPEPVLGAGLIVAGLGAAVGLLGGGFITLIPKIAATRLAMSELGISGKAAAVGVGALSVGLVGAGLIISNYLEQQAQMKADTTELKETLDKATGATTNYTRAAIARKLAEDGSFESAQRAGVGQSELTDAVLKGGAAYDEIQHKIAGTNTFGGIFDGTSLSAYNAGQNISMLRDSVDASGKAFQNQAAAADGSTTATDNISGALEGVSVTASDAAGDIDNLKEAIEGFGKTQLDVNSTTRDLEAAVDDLAKSVTDNGTSLDVTTEAGRANQAALDDIAKSTLAFSSATLSQTDSQEEATKALADGRQKLIDSLAQFGITGQAAQDYADKLGLIPANIASSVAVTGSTEAIQAAEAVRNAINSIPGYRDVVINQEMKETGRPHGEVAGAYATGGRIQGPGSGTSDSIPIYVSNGEYILSARDVNLMGGPNSVDAFRQSLGSAKGYANGGAVAANYMYAPPNYRYASAPSAGGKREATVIINPAPGTSETTIGKVAVSTLNYELGKMP